MRTRIEDELIQKVLHSCTRLEDSVEIYRPTAKSKLAYVNVLKTIVSLQTAKLNEMIVSNKGHVAEKANQYLEILRRERNVVISELGDIDNQRSELEQLSRYDLFTPKVIINDYLVPLTNDLMNNYLDLVAYSKWPGPEDTHVIKINDDLIYPVVQTVLLRKIKIDLSIRLRVGQKCVLLKESRDKGNYALRLDLGHSNYCNIPVPAEQIRGLNINNNDWQRRSIFTKYRLEVTLKLNARIDFDTTDKIEIKKGSSVILYKKDNEYFLSLNSGIYSKSSIGVNPEEISNYKEVLWNPYGEKPFFNPEAATYGDLGALKVGTVNDSYLLAAMEAVNQTDSSWIYRKMLDLSPREQVMVGFIGDNKDEFIFRVSKDLPAFKNSSDIEDVSLAKSEYLAGQIVEKTYAYFKARQANLNYLPSLTELNKGNPAEVLSHLSGARFKMIGIQNANINKDKVLNLPIWNSEIVEISERTRYLSGEDLRPYWKELIEKMPNGFWGDYDMHQKTECIKSWIPFLYHNCIQRLVNIVGGGNKQIEFSYIKQLLLAELINRHRINNREIIPEMRERVLNYLQRTRIFQYKRTDRYNSVQMEVYETIDNQLKKKNRGTVPGIPVVGKTLPEGKGDWIGIEEEQYYALLGTYGDNLNDWTRHPQRLLITVKNPGLPGRLIGRNYVLKPKRVGVPFVSIHEKTATYEPYFEIELSDFCQMFDSITKIVEP